MPYRQSLEALWQFAHDLRKQLDLIRTARISRE